MRHSEQRACSREQTTFDVEGAAEDTWQALIDVRAFIGGDFQLASGARATLKVNTEKLYDHQKQLDIILEHFANFPCVQDADALLYVPNGMRRFMTLLSGELGKPLVHTERVGTNNPNFKFAFHSLADVALIQSVEKPLIGEDVVTTLGSVAALRALLPQADVHSLAILRRGEVHSEYKQGLTDHYLLGAEIPIEKEAFHERYSDVPIV